MRFYYRRGGKGAAPEGFDRVYTEVDGDGNVLRELLAYVRADDSVTVEMDGELGGTAGAFVEMALALYRQQATLLCKSPKIDTAAGHWQAVLSDLALLTSRDTGDAARLSRFMEGLHRCFDLVERRQMTVSRLFHLRTCSGFTPTCSATCRAVSVPPESSHIRRALSRSGFRSLAMRPPRPLSFVFHFSFRALPRKCVKNGPCSKHGPFSGFRRRGGMRRPYRCVHFSQCQL